MYDLAKMNDDLSRSLNVSRKECELARKECASRLAAGDKMAHELNGLRRDLDAEKLQTSLQARIIDSLKRELAASEKKLEEAAAALSSRDKDLAMATEVIKTKDVQLHDVAERTRTEVSYEFITNMHLNFFHTFAGQQVLGDMHVPFITAYRNSTQYLYDEGKNIGHYAQCGYNSAVKQARAADFDGRFKGLDKNDITATPHFQGDQSVSPFHPWWVEYMKSVQFKFANRTDIDFLDIDSNPTYKLPILEFTPTGEVKEVDASLGDLRRVERGEASGTAEENPDPPAQ